MTTGAGESIDSLRALYTDPVGTVAAVREIPGAIANLDAIIAAMPESIETQQRRNNPHDPDTDPQLYESYRQGWYEGYIAWFVIESAVPSGEAGKALKSSKRVQKTVDKLSTSRVRRAAQLAGRASHTAKAPVRFSRLQFSRGLSTGIGLTQEAGENVLSSVSTVGQQYRVAKLLDRHDVDGTDINRLDADEQSAVGRTVARGGDDTARAMASGGPGPFARAHQLDIDVDKEALASSLGRHTDEVGFAGIEQVVDDLEGLKRADVDNIDKLANDLIAPDISNFKGAAFEARYATIRKQDVVAVQQSNRVSSRPGDIDVVTSEQGTRVGNEVKNRNFDSWDFDEFKGYVGDVDAGYQRIIESDTIDIQAYKIVFNERPPSQYREYMDAEGINYEYVQD
ncbi:hypothetical protein [Natrinema salifodinae]|uniref:Uncharacterized protein n=1 Tax=Natrinema salifodinae TaxID=1202768 RepID=A0A1I0QH17_9EURY|nr:hypothetical protein [Natrinema salifodinae]SEW26262.1 hypothetical protein SAMN05216285_3559 [Natrinema salifodinae]